VSLDEENGVAGGNRGGSAGLIFLAVCGFLALSIVYIESAQLPDIAGRAVADLAFLIPIAISTVLSFVAQRRSTGVEAKFWLLCAALNSLLLVAELYWVWWLISLGEAPPPIYAPFQVMHLVAAVIFLMMLAVMVRLADTPAPTRIRWWLDLSAVAVVAYVALLELYVDPLFDRIPTASTSSRLIAAVYAVWGVMMIAGGLWVLLRPGLMRWRLWERTIGASIIIYAGGIMLWPVWFAAFEGGASSSERNIFDLVLVLGHYLFVIAAAERLIHGRELRPMRRLGPARGVAGRAATYMALAVSVVSLPVLIAAAVISAPGSLDRVVFIIAGGLVAGLTVVRTIVAALENGRLFRTAVTDPLTGLYNHRHFHEQLASELEVARRFGEPLTVMWADIDGFGRFNRLAGHVAGDELLLVVARALGSACIKGAVACRVGGDEFAVVARGGDCGAATAMGERLRAELRSSVDGDATPPTVSIGVACYPGDGDDATALAGAAERASGWAREHGKDRVFVYDPELVGDRDIAERLGEIEERTNIGTLRALAVAVDARRQTAGTRSATVSALAAALARQLGLDDERARLIELAALVHDVGMISLPDEILAKPGPLDAAETAQMRRHPELGEQIVAASAPPRIVPWIRHHQERWDGEGYPDGLRAVAIPLEARIIAVCDAWTAMTSDRPYRNAKSPAEAVAELRACAGTQLDPELIEPFVKLVEAFHKL